MNEDLVDVVLTRASDDDTLSDDAKLLVLGALTGESDLTDPERLPPALPEASEAQAARAYLAAVTVAGFRGIGPEARLDLIPGPGLTVVAGRNGCGKSSFAEALEVASTRGAYRASQRAPLWQNSWRNVHCGRTSVQIEFAEEGRGRTTVGVDWGAEDESLSGGNAWTQRSGEKRERGLGALGWSSFMETFRPFLSYDDLGALFAEPSRLHDALLPILGLERLDDAQRRLDDAKRQVGVPEKTAQRLSKEIRPELEASGDQRAGQALTAMRRRPPRVDEVRALVTGVGGGAEGELGRLRQLAAVQAPDVEAFERARADYLAAAERRSSLDGDAERAGDRKRDLLMAALDIHDEGGDGPCPVCEVGRLDSAWAERCRAELAADRQRVDALAAATRGRDAAARALISLVVPAPALPPVGLPDLDRLAVAAGAAWQAFQELATDARTLAARGSAALAGVAAAVVDLVAAAHTELDRRESAWQPLAVRLGGWCTEAEAAARNRQRLDDLDKAAAWFRRNTQALANERLQPFAERTKHIWSLLRQDSAVDLGAITLDGANTRRRVRLAGTVDGADAAPLGVMSNGELHALALALFLPRVMAPESPFGFVVVDDPVQAMDPAKVDGLARILAEAAKDRQVVVLTHDDRLPEAVRRLEIPARLLEVERSAGSQVTVADMSDPSRRYLEDARAIASDRSVSSDIRDRVVPELCRLALEAACRDRWYAAQLLAGTPRVRTERLWEATTGARGRLGLAVFGDPHASLDAWLATGQRRRALGVCTSAVHEGLRDDPHRAIDAVEALVEDVRTSRGRR